MSEEFEPGCGVAFFSLVVLVVAYLIGLGIMDGMTEGPRQWWHYVVALPIGVICGNLFFGIVRAMAS